MNEATQNGPARRRRCNATEGEHDAVLLAFLGSDLEAAEAAMPLPLPPRVPNLLGMPRLLRTPSAGMAAVDFATIAPRRAA